MTSPLPAHAHANAAVTERELSFDALVAEFGQPEPGQQPEFEPKLKPAREPKLKPAREPKLKPARETRAKPAREPRAQSAREAKPNSAAADTRKARQPSRAVLQLPDAETIKLLGLVVVVVISSTLAAVALTR